MKSSSSYYWYGDHDVSAVARLWKQNQSDVWTRQQNRGPLFGVINRPLNHLLGQHGRVVFSQSIPSAYIENATSNPLMKMTWLDNVDNARDYTVNIVAVARESGSGNAYAQIDSVAGGHNLIATSVSAVFPQDLYSFSFDVNRGAVSDAWVDNTLLTANNMSIVSVSIQEKNVSLLDTDDDHIAVPNYPCQAGQAITSNISEDTRAALHELRTTNLGLAFSWSALASGGTWQTPAASNEHGVKCATASWTNMIDSAYGARDAATPGWFCSGHKMAKGYEGFTTGNDVWIKPYVYGRAAVDYSGFPGPPTYGGQVKFTGPAGTSVTSSTINITYNASPQWFAGDAFCVNSSIADTVSDATANKVDPTIYAINHDNGDGYTQNTLYIYGMFGVYVYAP